MMMKCSGIELLLILLFLPLSIAAMAPSCIRSRKITSSSSNLVISYVESYPDDADNNNEPVAILIHGLDSSSHTWRKVQQSLSTPSIAIDCRGCGHSDLGHPDEFGAEGLIADIKCIVDSHPLLQRKRFVLVGHSMGGRIAMCYAAKHPEDISALVIEDMDIKRRPITTNFIPNFDEAKAVDFVRLHPNLDSLKKNFRDIGYPSDMLEKWIREGRVHEHGSDGEYWSDVNPAFRALCYRKIFDSDSGSTCWNAISNSAITKVYLMVAGIGTVCDQQSINDMVACMPSLSVKTYDEGYHSIHGSVTGEFLHDLQEIINDVKVAQCKL